MPPLTFAGPAATRRGRRSAAIPAHASGATSPAARPAVSAAPRAPTNAEPAVVELAEVRVP